MINVSQLLSQMNFFMIEQLLSELNFFTYKYKGIQTDTIGKAEGNNFYQAGLNYHAVMIRFADASCN